MPKKKTAIVASRRQYTPEFKAEAVKLVTEKGLTQAEAARDLGVAESVLGRWMQSVRRTASPDALSGQERDELAQLRRENGILRKERDILKKAAAFFAKEIL